MKILSVVTVMLGFALVQAGKAEDQDEAKVPKPHAKPTPSAHRPPPKVVPHVQQPNVQSPYRVPKANPSQPGANPPANQPRYQRDLRVPVNPSGPRVYVPKPQGTPPIQGDVNARNRQLQEKYNWQNRNGANPNLNHGQLNNRNWNKNNPAPNRPQNTIAWDDARRRHYRQYHHPEWWRNHYTRFAIFGGGYYFLDNGYWYPAYGYDPAYNTYDYEEPIYSYGNLEPAEVIANVQTALQNLGYFPYEIDGLMGPATRSAISNYQRDNGLEITSAIDQPTLDSLGLFQGD
jgi:hypothetical protein